MELLTTCPICSNPYYKELYHFNPACWIPGYVVRCSNCNLIYKIYDKAKPLIEYYNQDSFAQLDYWQQGEQATKQSLKKILDSIISMVGTPVSSLSLLDVGCGSGVFLSLAQQAGFKVTGLEVNPLLANKAYEKTKAEVITDEVMSTKLSGKQFNVITLLDLIEHLSDPLSVLKWCHNLLKPGGYLVVYTPNHQSLIVRIADLIYRLTLKKVKKPIIEIFDCLHVIFFDVQTLSLAMDKANFNSIKTSLLKYDPSRSNQATGVLAFGLNVIEIISPLTKSQFRILLFAQK